MVMVVACTLSPGVDLTKMCVPEYRVPLLSFLAPGVR
jgi:hypothetical protein